MLDHYNKIIGFIREYYNNPNEFIPLHEPRFIGNEKAYVLDAIESTFVSSVGKYVDRFEKMMQDYTGASFAVATVNGSAALHMCLLVAGVQRGDLVITQPLSFVATSNAITYTGAEPLFVDVDTETMGLSPAALESFLTGHASVKNSECIHTVTGRKISACVPMHTFGHPVKIDAIAGICDRFCIPLIEDAAESMGSRYQKKHTGTFGLMGAFSFNGNKTITCGGGGAIITNNEHIARLAKHLTTQAKLPHRWEFRHDHTAFNYRLPNLNAAFACAQLEMLDRFIEAKRTIAGAYASVISSLENINFFTEPRDAYSNYWLNCILLADRSERDSFLELSNDQGVMTRPAWTLMNDLPMFKDCISTDIPNARFLEERIVNLPSSVNLPDSSPGSHASLKNKMPATL